MAETYPAESGGFPDSHTTSTTYTSTTTTQQAPASSSMQCTMNKAYPRTTPGILKIVQIVFGFLYWTVVVSIYGYFNGKGWIITVGVTSLIFTLIIFLLFLFELTKRVTIINWVLTELLNNAVWCLMHFIAAIMISVAAGKYSQDKMVWGTLCGWTLTFLYGASLFFNFRDFQAMGGLNSIRMPGQSTTTTATTTTTTVVTTTGGEVDEKTENPPPYPGAPSPRPPSPPSIPDGAGL